MSEAIMQLPHVDKISREGLWKRVSFPSFHFRALEIFLEDTSTKTINIDMETIIEKIRSELANLPSIEQIWLEDLGNRINVFFNTTDILNKTLHPIFNTQYDLEKEFDHILFNFEVNKINLEEKIKLGQLTQIA